MPMIHIWMHEGKPKQYKKHVSEGIHAAMVDVLGAPADTWDHMFNDMAPGDMVYAPNFFDIPRSTDVIFIHFFLNERPKEIKARFFETCADEVTKRCGLRREDLMMTISETASENWWVHGRKVDPKTGFDARMSGRG